MNEKKYLCSLRQRLHNLSREDRKTILEACREHFREGRSSGLNEEDVVQSLGPPEEMAAEAVKELGKEQNWRSPVAAVAHITLSGLAMLLFNFMLFIPIFAALASVLLTLWAVNLSMLLTGVGIFAVSFLHPLFRLFAASYILNLHTFTDHIIVFFAGLSLMSLSLLLGIGMYYVSLWFIKFTKNYIKINIRIVGGKS